jgi:hypothetical protein
LSYFNRLEPEFQVESIRASLSLKSGISLGEPGLALARKCSAFPFRAALFHAPVS